MTASDIQCAYCGVKGKREDFEQPKNRLVKTFKYCGHNPFSGHLHYQCPSCAIILLVQPTDVLEAQNNHSIYARAPHGKPREVISRAD